MSLRAPNAYACVLATICALGASACGGGGAAAQGPGPGAMPPADVKAVTLAQRPVPRTSEFIATIRSLSSSTDPAAGRGHRHPHLREGRRPRPARAAARPDRARQAAGVGGEPRGDARGAAGRRRVRAAAARAHAEAARRRRRQPPGARTGGDRAPDRRGAAEGRDRRRSARARWSCGYYRVTAPSGRDRRRDPGRQGDRVTPATEITTIDQANGFEAYIQVPLERAADLRPGLPVRAARRRRQGHRAPTRSRSSHRAPTTRRSRSWSRRSCAARRRRSACMQYVRSRIVWSSEPRRSRCPSSP